MLYQKSSYVLMVLLSIFLTKNRVYAQDSTSVKLGFFAGSGIVFESKSLIKNGEEVNIPISERGVYFVSVVMKDKVLTQKIIIQ